VTRARELLSALMSPQAGGLLGVPGISGVARGRTWDAVVSAHAPDVTGDSVVFVALADGTLVVEEDVPDGSLAPLADAIETTVAPPYRAAGARTDADVWSAIAESVSIVEISLDNGDVIDLSVVDGVRELTIDGESTIRPVAALDELAAQHGDISLHAERVDGDLFAVDVFPL